MIMKTIDKHSIRNAKLVLSVLVTVNLTTVCFGSLSTQDNIQKYYAVDIGFFSIDLTKPMESYRWNGSGNAGTGGSVGLGCSDDVRDFRIVVLSKNVKGRFVVNVEVAPGTNDPVTKRDSFDVDLTDLKPRSLELAKNDDGRVYMLNLTPGIAVVDNRPKRADDTTFKFSRWSLHDSMVILNDSVYAGKLGVSGGPLAHISYPGFGKVEFALKPFRGAKRLGTLRDGRIQIRLEDGQSLDIYGVKNGVHRIQLPGGPYEVWVRWQDLPEEATFEVPPKEDWIRMVKAGLAERGAPIPADDEWDKLYQRAKNERARPLSGGVSSFGPSDRIAD
jgi:hypothetical protein